MHLWTLRAACELLHSGVAGIFGPQAKSTMDHIQSMCDTLDIPHIVARWDVEPKRGNVVNLYPHTDTLFTVLLIPINYNTGDLRISALTTRGLTQEFVVRITNPRLHKMFKLK